MSGSVAGTEQKDFQSARKVRNANPNSGKQYGNHFKQKG
ncbi:hypothetical protein COLO4_36287 [Corchorus olitorius]|uniref:Uncharacterized protein n=1 Tax=Corchorus olitorius TaxID=93759 RepID=A0A1R3GA40_9ROSI|nr:hypothetical protein COLO4_36287 [Corchorus olitorius]